MEAEVTQAKVQEVVVGAQCQQRWETEEDRWKWRRRREGGGEDRLRGGGGTSEAEKAEEARGMAVQDRGLEAAKRGAGKKDAEGGRSRA